MQYVGKYPEMDLFDKDILSLSGKWLADRIVVLLPWEVASHPLLSQLAKQYLHLVTRIVT